MGLLSRTDLCYITSAVLAGRKWSCTCVRRKWNTPFSGSVPIGLMRQLGRTSVLECCRNVDSGSRLAPGCLLSWLSQMRQLGFRCLDLCLGLLLTWVRFCFVWSGCSALPASVGFCSFSNWWSPLFLRNSWRSFGDSRACITSLSAQ